MRTFLCVLAAGLMLVLGGCGGGENGTTSGPAGPAKAAGPEAARPDAGGAGATGAAATARNVRLAPRSVVYTADMAVRAGDVPGAAARAKQIVAAAGGYVGNEESANSPGSPATATITFKIPSDRYPQTLQQLGSAQVGERTSLHQQADDVTQDVADVNSRVASAKAALASFRSLLAKATSVNDIVQLEQEIAQRESDLESLQARQRSLAAETTYATVTVRIEGLTAVRARHHGGRHGFTGGLAAGWRSFVAFAGVVALVVGWLVPFTPVIALIAAAGYGYRRWRRVHPRPAVRAPRPVGAFAAAGAGAAPAHPGGAPYMAAPGRGGPAAAPSAAPSGPSAPPSGGTAGPHGSDAGARPRPRSSQAGSGAEPAPGAPPPHGAEAAGAAGRAAGPDGTGGAVAGPDDPSGTPGTGPTAPERAPDDTRDEPGPDR